jgi:HD-GYP domain-containing protein (c-di-GMP phosphodiesterase class II)
VAIDRADEVGEKPAGPAPSGVERVTAPTRVDASSASDTSPGKQMYRKSLDMLHPGDVIAKTVHADGDMVLLAAGTTLTPGYISALERRGVSAVYVRDGLADDIVPSDIVSEQVRATLTGQVSAIFERVSQVGGERGCGAGGVAGAIGNLGEQPLDVGDDGMVEQLYSDVELLITEILEANTVAGLESLKTHNEYTFQHSVDVAVLGTLMGKNMGMPRARLRELALGCLLHDIGKTYIDVAILDKPGKLTPEEFEAVKEHPRMGFELVRRLPMHTILPAHVAYQHHERQRGGGYPRGLIGDNRISGRVSKESIGAGKLLLIAEIGAVADVYSALTSDRPYRPGIPADEANRMMRDMAGGHLNREVVDLLLQLVPGHPEGTWVEVQSGIYKGWQGVVTDVPRGRVNSPTVRLLLDDRREALASPFELDIRDHAGVSLRNVSPSRLPMADAALAS